jgi:type II secretory pathway pseudopilin PulG
MHISQTRIRRDGFTLTESLLSVAITATALLSVIGLLIGALSEARDSRAMTIAGMLVRQLAGEARELAADPAAPLEVIVLVDSALQVMKHSRETGGGLNGEYQTGSSDPAASSFARMVREVDVSNPLVERIMITVETPASAPAQQRRVFHYATVAAK